MSNKLLITALVASVVAFLLGFLIYGIALGGYFEGETLEGLMRPEGEMVWWAMIVGHLAMGFLLTYIIGKWAGISTLASGAKAGALIGLLVSLTYNMIAYGTSVGASLNASLVDCLVTTVISAIVGGVIGMMMGRE